MRKLLLLIFALVSSVVAPTYYFLNSRVAEVPATVAAENVSVPAAPDKNNPAEKFRLLFVGDIMLDRWIRQVSEKKGIDFIFQDVDAMLADHDLVVGNLEGPITDNVSVSVASEFGSRANYIFTFPPETAGILASKNIRLVSLGNNHIMNQGAGGLASTKKYLRAAGVDFFGDPQSIDQRTFLQTVGGTRLAVVSYDQFMPDAIDAALAEIKYAQAHDADPILLYAHWGTEYAPEPSAQIKNLAHQFIEAGADLIIGTHPHVIQPSELYLGKKIYYSLGNFIFDQYFRPETQKGLAVAVEIDPENKSMNFQDYPVVMQTNGQTIRQK